MNTPKPAPKPAAEPAKEEAKPAAPAAAGKEAKGPEVPETVRRGKEQAINCTKVVHI